MCRPISPRNNKASSSGSSSSIWIALPAGVTIMAILSTAMHHLLTPESSFSFDDVSENPSLVVGAISTMVCLVAAVVYTVYNSGPKKVLPLDDFVPVPLIRKEVLSHDTRRFTFGLGDKNAVLGLPTGQHVSLKFTNPATNKAVLRSYTPVTDDTIGAAGEFSLVIKVYRPLPPQFPQGGLMSQHLDDLKLGDTILMKGPKGHLTYTNSKTGMATNFTVKPLGKPLEHRSAQHYGMMAGGTGITPMLQILNTMFRHGDDSNPNVCVKLIYANQTVDDILVRQELEALQKDFPTRFQLYYTVDKVAPDQEKTWTYGTGFITKDMIQQHLLFSGTTQGQQFFMCGPPPMIKFACLPALTELGFSAKDWVVF